VEGFPYSVTLPVYTHQMQNNPFHRPHTIVKCLSYLGKYLRRTLIVTSPSSTGRIPRDDGGGDGNNYNTVGTMSSGVEWISVLQILCQYAVLRRVRASTCDCAWSRPFPGCDVKVRAYSINFPATHFKRPMSSLGGKLTGKQCELRSSETRKLQLFSLYTYLILNIHRELLSFINVRIYFFIKQLILVYVNSYVMIILLNSVWMFTYYFSKNTFFLYEINR